MSTFKVQLLLGLGTDITLAALSKTIRNSLLVSWIWNNSDVANLICFQLAFFKHVHEDRNLSILIYDRLLLLFHEALHLVNLGQLRSDLIVSPRRLCLLFLDGLLRSSSFRCHLQ